MTTGKPYTLKEAADLLRKSPRVVRGMAQRKEISPAFRLGGDWIFPRHAKLVDDRGTVFFLGSLEGVK